LGRRLEQAKAEKEAREFRESLEASPKAEATLEHSGLNASQPRRPREQEQELAAIRRELGLDWTREEEIADIRRRIRGDDEIETRGPERAEGS
jgi:hypothetical protein